jgi:hypothetical protein
MSRQLSWKARLKARLFGHSIDERLLAGADPAADEALAARLELLLSREYRARIAEALRRLVAAAAGRPGEWRWFELASRPEVREMDGELLELARQLEQDDDARPRGVILASRLITDGATSPVYWPTTRAALEAWIKHARAALSLG